MPSQGRFWKFVITVHLKKVPREIIGDSGMIMDIYVATFCLLGMLNWIVQWYKPEGKVSPENLARDICRFFLSSGLKGGNAQRD